MHKFGNQLERGVFETREMKKKRKGKKAKEKRRLAQSLQ
jgi:hypothetical protein